MSAEELTSQEAADYQGLSIKAVYRQRFLGIGPVSHRRNGRIVFLRSDIDAYHERERARTLRGEGV
jgi:hypothetical protein